METGRLVFVLCWYVWHVIAATPGKVDVTVYYETLCPDSVSFVTRQLYPTWRLLGDYMNIELVPFGKAYRDENGELHCQHGRNECEGNKLQSCALDLMEQGSAEQVNFVNCVMGSRSPLSAIPKCSENYGVSWPVVAQCGQSDHGIELQSIAEKKTVAVAPKLGFVPTITFNHKFNQQNQKDAQYDLLAVVCRHISAPRPAGCPF